MGGSHHDTTVNVVDNITKTDNQTTDNYQTNIVNTHLTTNQNNVVDGDKVMGGQVVQDNTANSGRAIYHLMNLDTVNTGIQQFGTINGLGAADILAIANQGGIDAAYAAAGIHRAQRVLLI